MAWMKPALPLGAFMLFGTHPVAAQDYPDDFALNVGVSYVRDADTEVSARSPVGVIGTSIDFERDLDGEDRVSPTWWNGYYRFTPHHRVDFAWIRFNREGSRSLEREVTFQGTTFSANASVDSEIESTFSKLAYTWSFHHTDEVELGLTLGAAFVDYAVELQGPLNQADAGVDVTVPTLGFRVDYEIGPRMHLSLKSDALYFDTSDEELEGSIDNTTLALEWRAVRNVVLGLGLDRLAVDAAVDDGDWRGRVSDFYRSTRVYAGLRF